MRAMLGMVEFFFFTLIIVVIIKRIRIKGINKLILIVSGMFAILAFFQGVSELSDLQEAFGHLRLLKHSGMSYFKNSDYTVQIYFGGKITMQLYFLLMSKLPFLNFYSATAVFVMYFCVLKAIDIACKKWDIDEGTEKNLFLFFILIFPFYSAANGVRNYFAFSIVTLGLALDLLKEKKFLPWILYLIAGFFHPAAWLLIAIRCMLPVRSIVVKIVVFFLLAFWSRMIDIIASLLRPFTYIDIVSQAYSKLTTYTLLEGTTFNFGDVFNTSSAYMMMVGFRILFIIVVLWLIFSIWRRKRKISSLTTYVFYLSAFALGSAAANVATNVLARYSTAIFMVTGLFLCEYYRSDTRKKFILIGNTKISASTFMLGMCVLLLNWYMYTNQYTSFFINFKLLT